MGGVPPLGYDVVERKLVVNVKEAALVRDIFRRYGEHGSAAQLVRELAVEGQTTKCWITQTGNVREGRPIDQQILFVMLRNRTYLGEMPFKGQSFAGQHDAIVAKETWDAVQAFVVQRAQGPREQRSTHAVLLAGLLFAPDGQRMLHTFVTKKNGRRYRYYVPYLYKRRNAGATDKPGAVYIGPMPAGEIEAAVLKEIHTALKAPQMLVGIWKSCQQQSEGAALDEAHVVVAMQRIGEVWEQLFPAEQQRIARLLIERVQLHDQGLDILWREDGWAGLGPDIAGHPLVTESMAQAEEVEA
jgi:hypothetical protein